MGTSEVGEDRHEYSYYEKCNREVERIRDYLVLRGFGVDCAENGVSEVVISLLDVLFMSVEPESIPVLSTGDGWAPVDSEGPGSYSSDVEGDN